jgi:hypothetical protein
MSATNPHSQENGPKKEILDYLLVLASNPKEAKKYRNGARAACKDWGLKRKQIDDVVSGDEKKIRRRIVCESSHRLGKDKELAIRPANVGTIVAAMPPPHPVK